MTHPQQTTREVLEKAYAHALKLHNDHWVHWDDNDIAESNENLSMLRAALAHPTPSTTGEALVKLIPTAEELGAPQVEPAPSREHALQRLSNLGQQLQPQEFGMAPSTAGERADIMRMAADAGLGQYLPAEHGLPATWVGTDLSIVHRFAALLQSPANHIPDAGKMLSEIRDIFPIPAPGSPLELAWMEAMGEPESVPDYVRACIAAMPVGELTDDILWDLFYKHAEITGFTTKDTYTNFARDVLAAARSQPPNDPDELYWKLHSLSKSMEGSGRIDDYDNPEAYGVLLDAMNALRAGAQPVREPLTEAQWDELAALTGCESFTRIGKAAISRILGITKKGEQ